MSYSILNMPLNADGNGPEMDPSKVVKTIWQILDAEFTTISEHDAKHEAEDKLDWLQNQR